MDKKIYFIRKLLRPFIVFVLFAFFNQSIAQTLQRQSIGSGGGNILTDGTLIQQSIGQPFGTGTSYTNGISFRPGFQQPVFKVNFIYSTISLKVFPNPASQMVTIQSQDLLKDIVIQVLDISGKLMIQEHISEFISYSFNCENWANGIYMISVSDSGKNEYSSKLIILK